MSNSCPSYPLRVVLLSLHLLLASPNLTVWKPLHTPAFTLSVCQGWCVFIMCIFARMCACMHACALYVICIHYAVCVLYIFIYIYGFTSHKLSFDELSGQPCCMRPSVFGRREKNTFYHACFVHDTKYYKTMRSERQTGVQYLLTRFTTHARTHTHSQGRVPSDILDVYTAQ